MPFEVLRKGDVLHLVLDTPGSRVNIFNRDTARQTLEVMKALDPKQTRAIVFRSAKPDSFINGVGLMLANAARSHDDVVRVSAELREAFLAVRRCPVPTIAAVQGTCWGCGVEFVLNCDHRIAADTYRTHFYMTELHDYLFIPLFGATQNLPSTVGFEDAVDLLLWGERWDVRHAAARGLINEHAGAEGFDAAIDAFVGRVLEGKVASCIRKPRVAWRPEDEAVLACAQARIAALPAAYQKVYRDALELLTRASQEDVGSEHSAREIAKCAESSLAEVGKSAFAFFYIRQTAAELSLAGGPPDRRLTRVVLSADLARFREELARRSPPEIAVDMQETAGGALSFGSMGTTAADAVATCLAFAEGPSASSVVLYRPFGERFFELVERQRGEARLLVDYLRRAGYEVALSRADRMFGVNRLLGATFAPLVRDVLLGGDPATIATTLRDFGFAHWPGDLIAYLGRRAFSEFLRPWWPRSAGAHEVESALSRLESCEAGGRSRPELVFALTVSWLAAALENLEHGGLVHPTFIDLAAREVLDFPLAHISLCRYLTPARVRAALDEKEALGSLVREDDVQRAEAFVASGARFYR